MASTFVSANDNIGLSINHNSSQFSFYIPATHEGNTNKILELCVDEILDKFNP